MHALYRKHFNAVDLFNKASLQPGTVTDVWKTKKAHMRLFAATWAWIETNGMMAYHRHNPDWKMTKREWYLALVDAYINNPFSSIRPRGVPEVPNGHKSVTQGSKAQCWVCEHKTQWKCSCGRPVCGASTKAKERGGEKAAQEEPRTCRWDQWQAVRAGAPYHCLPYVARRGPGPKA